MLSAEKIIKRFNDQICIENFSHSFLPGQIYLLSGPSGQGKSTLLALLANIENFESGLIEYMGRSINSYDNYLSQIVSYLPQNVFLLPDLTVYENIVLRAYISNQSIKEISLIAQNLMIEDLLDKMPYALSGGQKQRVALAQVFVGNTPIILLDEPTSYLDQKNISIVVNLITQTAHQGKIVILASHSPELFETALKIDQFKFFIEK